MSLLCWDNRVPKRFVIAMNRLGVAGSYPFQCRLVLNLSHDSINDARKAANNPLTGNVFPYDNFNWRKIAREASALHKSVQHDQVSALLITIEPMEELTGTLTMKDIMSVEAVTKTEGSRHNIPPIESLASILPKAEDHKSVRDNAVLHVARILCEENDLLAPLAKTIPLFSDPEAIPTHKTEGYYLPAFDQEQGSTRGNMEVLKHYFHDVLNMPMETFETTMQTVVGDRLTTARDRAAQDQRAVDMSEHRFDHLSSFAMTSGLMHYILNYVQAIGKEFWGTTSAADPLSFANIKEQLPNRDDINLRHVDYYAWLRFLDVILRSLVLSASANIPSSVSSTSSTEHVLTHAANIVDQFFAQSPNRLEATKVKTLKGNTVSANGMALFYILMLLREMQSAVKLGHAGRIHRTLRFWLPIFYAAGSYNYANETMELLHNLEHDWPKPFAKFNMASMLVNPRGRAGDWKPTDICVEHLNDRIKEHAHGSNATPELLTKITPAMGHIQAFTDRLFEDLGVEAQNQKHKHVSQRRDVQLLFAYFQKHHVFDFARDKASSGKFRSNLFIEGMRQLSGKNGGHAEHLARHLLRLRSRHSEDSTPLPPALAAALQDNPDVFQELEIAQDVNVTMQGTTSPAVAAPSAHLIDIEGIGRGYREEDDEEIEG